MSDKPFTVTMPKLSPTMEEGTITTWKKNIGDRVESGEVLIEVATDKATVEYEALDEGFLRKILVNEGGLAKVNDPIAVFTAEEATSIEGYETVVTKAPAEDSKSEESAEVRDSASAPAQMAGTWSQPAFAPEPPLVNYEHKFLTESSVEGKLRASPLARRLAKEKGLDLSRVKGTGPGGRIIRDDLDLAGPNVTASFGPQKMLDIAPGSYEEEVLSPIRKVIGQRLQESKSFIPHFYTTVEIDAGEMINAREQLKKLGHKISFNDIVVKATALALKKHPNINTGYNSVTNSIINFKTIDISIAVSIEEGLITPIVRMADHKNLEQLSKEIRELAGRAHTGKLQPEEFKGGSFTVSNLGMFGVTDFSAIINPPQAAILAVGGVIEKPIVRKGEIAVGHTMKCTLSADHRVIDGADAAKFLKTLKELLENPIATVM